MLFEVQLMRGAGKAAKPRVLRTVNFEADDLFSGGLSNAHHPFNARL